MPTDALLESNAVINEEQSATPSQPATPSIESVCAICYEPKKPRRLHMICSVCDDQADKKTCLECWSKLLFSCDQLECVALHLKCPWCRTPLQQADLKASALFGSNAYNRAAVKIQYTHLCDLIFDREDTVGMLDRALSALTLMNRSMNQFQNNPRRMRRIVQRARRSHQAADTFLEAFEGYSTFRNMHPSVRERRTLYDQALAREAHARENSHFTDSSGEESDQ